MVGWMNGKGARRMMMVALTAVIATCSLAGSRPRTPLRSTPNPTPAGLSPCVRGGRRLRGGGTVRTRSGSQMVVPSDCGMVE
jgi:hypothetical protein